MIKKNLLFITLLILNIAFSFETSELTLRESSISLVKIDFNLSNINFESVDRFTKIVTNTKGETSIIGMPKLPEFSTLVKLDPQKTYDVSYNVNKSYILKDIDIIPNQKIENGLELKQIINIENEFYTSSKSYPENSVLLSSPKIMRDLVLSSLRIIPFKYNPENRELEVYESISIEIFEVSSTQDIRRREMPKSKVFENIYKNQIINYESSQRDNEYQQPAILYICPNSIINNSSFEQLVEWRRQRGYVVYTASTSQIGSSTSSIKNYIEDAYDDFNPPPEYVAFLGDVGGTYSIPTYYEDFGHDSYGSQCEGDHPYSQLDGNDLLPELLLGRMSIRSTSELTTVVYKILNYEKATYLTSYSDYYEKAAMAGDPSTSGNSCAITKEAVKTLLENHGFDNVNIKTSGNGWSTWMQNELSDGVLYFNYRGYLGMSGFDTNNIDNANSGWKLPFATILTCGTGSFAEDQTSMSEKFFRAGSVTNPKGGVASIGTATWNTHTLFNNIVDMGIYHGLFADKVETAGASLASGKFALFNTYPGDPYEWISAFTHWNNLMGDPATHLWTDTPEVLEATHDSSVLYGTNFYNVVVSARGNPLPGAFVSLLINGEDVATNLISDENGLVTFNLSPELNEEFIITVTKENFKPYQGNSTIVNSNENINLDNNEELIITDSNNSIVESGESIGLSIPLINYGNSIDNVSATLVSESEYVALENQTVIYGTIPSNSSLYGENFNLTISPAAMQYEDLQLRIVISVGLDVIAESILPLEVSGSLLTVSNSHSINPGGNSNFNIEVSNSGSIMASNVSAELSTTNNQVNIIDSNGLWGNISPGYSVNSYDGFTLSLGDDILAGTQILFNLRIQSDEGYDRNEIFILTAGNVSTEDPLGPDFYGYYIYDSGDINYDLVPDYDWIEIDNIGTDLNLSNSGNGNWSGNGPIGNYYLPFPFKFYGQTYNEITICTNGWIAFGDVNSESFRNYPIPGAGGPSPMISAFWDDLETGNNGNVYVYSTDEYVIIQWDQMRTNWNNSSNTFQIILYNNTAPPYSDNNIKIQYQDFNNTSSGSFTSYPPIHGSYATIGIENHFATDGLQYTYYNNYPDAAMTLSDETALYITTQAPIALPSPEINFEIDFTEFNVDNESVEETNLVLTNSGEEGSVLNYSISVAYPNIESPFDISGGGPDAFGYFWTDSDISNGFDYEWIDISSDGTQIMVPSNDGSSDNIEIGFEFPLYDQEYSQFFVNANGWIGFGEDNNEWYNGNLPNTEYPAPAIFGFWDDLNPVNDDCNSSCSGNIYYHTNSDRVVIWFNNIAHWASQDFENSFYDFQIVLYPSGEVNININSIEGNYSATVGMQNSTGTIATQVDEYNGSYFSNEVSFKFKKPFIPAQWLEVFGNNNNGLSGQLENDQSENFTVTANGFGLIQDQQYFADIIIATNYTTDIEIPITLNVTNFSGFLGDVNSDQQINIQDVVLLVGYILNESEYIYNGDINEDGFLDVIDIVQLVGIILN